MFDPALYIAFVGATILLMLIPGPNVALIVANSVAHGRRYGLMTVAGTSSAMIVQLGVTALGLTGALEVLGHFFEWARWVGVAYLVYLGYVQWNAPTATALTQMPPQQGSHKGIFARGFLVSLTNPKTLLFYSAFFPQFISHTSDARAQIAVLSATFLVIGLVVDSSWAFAASYARPLLTLHGRVRNRITGGFLIGAGIALGFAKRK